MKINLLYLLGVLLLANCSKQENNGRILIVTSNQHTYGSSEINASNHFAEIVEAYDIFVNNNFSVDVISPKGRAIPIGYISTSDSIQKKYIYKSEFMNVLKNTKKPSEINPNDYVAIYYSGGGAATFGIAENIEIKNIAEQIYNQNGIISAVCHGTAGIVNLKDKHGNSLYQNKEISGYPDLFENKGAAYYKTFPFSIEEKIKENNGNFLYSDQRQDNFYVIDENFITGQDPSATKSVAQQVVNILKNK